MSYSWTSGEVLLGSAATLDLRQTDLLPGDSLRCIIQAVDSQAAQVEQERTAVIGDRPPVLPELDISWGSVSLQPHDHSALFCQASGAIDPDGESISYAYQWSSSFGQVVGGQLVPAEQTIPTELWS